MKKIINKSLYNTDTARLVGQSDNGEQRGSFTRVDQDLYQTKSGKYFVYGYGGAMTVYAEHHGNNTAGGERIIPLSADEAREFAEEHLAVDIFISEFGEVEEASDERVQTAFTLSPETVALLKRKKAETGQTLSKLVADAIEKAYR